MNSLHPLFVVGARPTWNYPQSSYECQECKHEMERCRRLLQCQQPRHDDDSIYKRLGNYSRVCREKPTAVDHAAYFATQTPYMPMPMPMPMPGPLYREGSVLQDQSQAFTSNESRVQRRRSEGAEATKDVKEIANAYLRETIGKWESRPTSPNDVGCPPVDVLKRVVEALRELQDCDIDNIIKDIRCGKMGISENDVGNDQSPVHSC